MPTKEKPAKRRDKPIGVKGHAKVCGAGTRDGEPCTRPAGWGTDHRGSGRCKIHGGMSPGGKQSAARERMRDLARPIAVTPGRAVEAAMYSAAGELAYATARFGDLSEEELINDGQGHFHHRLKVHAEERLVKYAKVAADMGVDAARLKIAAAQTSMMGSFLEGVLARLDLTAAQRKQLGPAIRAELTKVTEATGEEIK